MSSGELLRNHSGVCVCVCWMKSPPLFAEGLTLLAPTHVDYGMLGPCSCHTVPERIPRIRPHTGLRVAASLLPSPPPDGGGTLTLQQQRRIYSSPSDVILGSFEPRLSRRYLLSFSGCPPCLLSPLLHAVLDPREAEFAHVDEHASSVASGSLPPPSPVSCYLGSWSRPRL